MGGLYCTVILESGDEIRELYHSITTFNHPNMIIALQIISLIFLNSLALMIRVLKVGLIT
jgi:hypothetical protein